LLYCILTIVLHFLSDELKNKQRRHEDLKDGGWKRGDGSEFQHDAVHIANCQLPTFTNGQQPSKNRAQL
jgi:hypothetical protein